MRWPWQLHRELDKRVEQARAEAERSRRELERTRTEVVAPLARYSERNHFASLLAESLQIGRGGRRA